MAKDLAYASNKKVLWLCDRKHLFCVEVSKVTLESRWCPYCAGKKILVGFNDLMTVDPYLALQIHGTSEFNGFEVSRWSHKYLQWVCSTCSNIWRASVANRSLGRGCPECSRKNTSGAEKKLQELLSKYYSTNTGHTTRLPLSWRTRSSVQVDTLIEDEKCVVEYDGAWYHHTGEAIQRDLEKNKLFRENGYRLVRIRETSERYPLNSLGPIDDKYLEIEYKYPDSGEIDLTETVERIREWLDD